MFLVWDLDGDFVIMQDQGVNLVVGVIGFDILIGLVLDGLLGMLSMVVMVDVVFIEKQVVVESIVEGEIDDDVVYK